MVGLGADPQPGKHGEKQQNGGRIGEGEEQDGEVRGLETAGLGRTRDGAVPRPGQRGLEPEPEQKGPAGRLHPELLAEQKRGDGTHANGGDQAVNGVGGGGAEAGDEAMQPAAGEGALDAEQIDRADRSGDRKPQNETFEPHGGRLAGKSRGRQSKSRGRVDWLAGGWRCDLLELSHQPAMAGNRTAAPETLFGY